jgi:triple functional domain protein
VEEAPEGVEGAQRRIEAAEEERSAALTFLVSTEAEGRRLLADLAAAGLSMEADNSGSFQALDAAMRTLDKQRLELEEIWEGRKLKLDVCLQLRLFERDALEISSQLDHLGEKLGSEDLLALGKELAGGGSDGAAAAATSVPVAIAHFEQLLRLHNENVGRIQASVFQTMGRGQELVGLLERSGVSVMASGQISAGTRVQVLLEYLGEKELDFGEVCEGKRVRLTQLIQKQQLLNDANQVGRNISKYEARMGF